MQKQDLEVRRRLENGKGTARKLRAQGYVPAVCYRKGLNPILLSLEKRELEKILQAAAGQNILIQLKIKGEEAAENQETVIVKEVQKDPLNRMLHADFMGVLMDQLITVEVAVRLVGEPTEALREGAMVQRDEVLSRMVQCDFLSEKDRESAQNDPIRLVALKDRHRGSSYVRESIRRQLQVILDRHGIRDGGLTIHTTLDAGLQSRCDQVLGAPLRGLERGKAGKLPRLQGAVVSIDAQTGGILSLCGGRNFRESSYNRAYLARRDLGPAFIPFLNAIALERGKVTIPGQPVQTGRQLGVDETIRVSKRLGLTGPFADTEDLYRGTIAASPVELAIATAVLTAEGNKIEPYIIARITDAAGRILYQRDPSNSQVIMKDSAIEALAGMNLKNNGSWIATTRSRHDAWALHIRESRVMAFWIGYDQPRVIAPRSDIKRAMQAMITRVQP